MQIVINVPEKEFSVEVEDKFQDFFKRLDVEMREHLVTGTSLLCEAYELEIIDMLLKGFKEMRVISDDATNGDIIKTMFPNINFQDMSFTVHATTDTAIGDVKR